MAAPLALAAAPAIPAVSNDLSGVVNNLIWSLTSRPEVVAMLLTSVPVMAFMPYLVLLVQWNLEHLKFESFRRVGEGTRTVVTSSGKIIEHPFFLPGTTSTIVRIDHPERELGHTISPPVISNLMESQEKAQETAFKMFESGGSFFDLLSGVFRQFTPPTPEV